MKPLFRFLLLVLLFSVPLWLAAIFFDATRIIPVKLPFSALQFVVVLISAIHVTRQRGGSVRELLLRGADVKRIASPMWLIAVLALMPVTVALSYLMEVWAGGPVPDKVTPFFALPIFLLIYGISGYCEEIGWTAIMTDDLFEQRYNPMMIGLLVGTTCAVWHIIPFIQTHNSAIWIIWQCIFTILCRVLMVRVYLRTHRSVFGMIAFHATYNAAFSLMPYYGSSYDPMYMSLATLCMTVLIFALRDSSQNNKLKPQRNRA